MPDFFGGIANAIKKSSDLLLKPIDNLIKPKSKSRPSPPVETTCAVCRFKHFRQAKKCPRCNETNELANRRFPIVGGNWKCNPASVQALDKLVANINACDTTACDVYFCPSPVHLALVSGKVTNGAMVCPQNCNFTGTGAYTGESAVEMLSYMGCSWVLLGHSERREYFNETDELLATKLAYVLSKGFKCVFAIGEKLKERQEGKTMAVCIKQLEKVTHLLHPDKVVIAYEPVWAIGTGVTATPEQAQETHAAIRTWLAQQIGSEYASYIRIQYGGSANAKNAPELSAMEDIDGFLVGGASLKPEFVDIVKTIGKAKAPFKQKVALIGSGNWGSAIATKIGINARACGDFHDRVDMWVFEEYVKQDGAGKWVRPARGDKPPAGKTWVDEGYEPLTEVINRLHENVIYLPGITLPPNIVAVPDIKAAVTDATMMVFVIPHNFLAPIVPKMEGAFAKGAIGCSLIKGIEFEKEGTFQPILISDLLTMEMQKGITGSWSVDMSVLMGANVANEVAQGDFAEATIGSPDPEQGLKWCKIFNTADFSVTAVPDVAGAELCGALKNVVALGAGFCDGIGFGGNTKAAIIRIGLTEMKRFCRMFYGGRGIKDATFLESCGVADLVTTCYGGRNRKCADLFVQHVLKGDPKTWASIEAEQLNGQKLQGTGTCEDVMKALKARKVEKQFPLFVQIHRIAFEGVAPSTLIEING